MGQALHGGAHTTQAVGRAIRLRQESVSAPAKRHGVSPTTVRTWRERSGTADGKRVRRSHARPRGLPSTR